MTDQIAGVAIFAKGIRAFVLEQHQTVFDPADDDDRPLSPLEIVEAVLTGIICASGGALAFLGLVAWFLWGLK